MIQTIQMLTKKGLASPPNWLCDNVIYATIVGSFAYGVSSDTSDCDIYGVCVEPRRQVFPFATGEHVYGFGKLPERFEQYIEHHIFDKDDLGGKGRTYDYTIFGLVKAFDLWSTGNPNCLEMLFTSNECIIQSTQLAKLIRDKREMFLTKQCYQKFIGYLSSQIHKAKIKQPTGKRAELVEKHSYDTKFIANSVRLAYECETILNERTIDLRRFSEHIKAIRRGEVALDEVMRWLDEKEVSLIKAHQESKIPQCVDMQEVTTFLLQCLEMHYGSIDKMVDRSTIEKQALNEIWNVLQRYKI